MNEGENHDINTYVAREVESEEMNEIQIDKEWGVNYNFTETDL
jgi:hypothetical protein